MTVKLKIASVNCQGLGTPSKRKDVLNYYKSKNYSILCLQDTHFIKDLEPYIETQWGYKCVFNSHTSNSRGVAVLFNNDFELKLHKEKKDNNGNLLALCGESVTRIVCYIPNCLCFVYKSLKSILYRIVLTMCDNQS